MHDWRGAVLPWVAALAVVTATALPAGSSRASSSEYTTSDIFRFMEDEMHVTTVNQVRTKLTEVPQPVYVISGDEVRRMAARGVADIVRYVPGAHVATAKAGQWSVVFHIEPLSMVNNFVLVLIDGRATDSSFGNITVWGALPVAPEDIERVEVVLGPASTTHGPQAVFGVVNFITKRPGAARLEASAATGSSLGGDSVLRHGDVHLHARADLPLSGVHAQVTGGFDRLTPWDDGSMVRDGRSVPPVASTRGFATLRLQGAAGPRASWSVGAGASAYEQTFVAFGAGYLAGHAAYLDGELHREALLGEGDSLELRLHARYDALDYDFLYTPLLPAQLCDPHDTALKAKAILDFFAWCYEHGGEVAQRLHYVPVPKEVISLVKAHWSRELRADGKPVWR